jgi:murein DD-endopeptidase MepM/ murein hydrolase activator NlpD
MANTITDIMPKILATGLLALREQAVMPRFVNGSFSAEAAQKGDTIDVPISSALTATDVTPSETPPVAVDSPLSKVQINLDKWKQARFHLTDKEMTEIDRNRHFMPLQTLEAVRALANRVNADIHAEYTGIYGFTGTPATTPFASDATDAIQARKILNQQRAPRADRRGVLDFDAEANALAIQTFADAEKTGENGVKIEGEIGRKYGVDWATDDNVVTHTAGTLTGTIVTSGAAVAGAKTVTLATDAAEAVNLVVGDIVTFAGDSQTYVITAAANIGASTTGAITFEPGLAVAQAGGEQITVKATHVVNLVFHRDAFAFANRPLAGSTQDTALGSQIMTMTDPQTGISLRLEVSRQHKQVAWDFDLLYGTKLVRPELATRIAG